MAKPTQRDKERAYFDRFVQCYELPDGKLVHGDKPDFIIRGTKKIGIEVTHFYLQSGGVPESEQRQRPLRETVIAEANRIYEDGGGNPVQWTSGFDLSCPIQQNETRQLAKNLAAFSLQYSGNSGSLYRYLFKPTLPQIDSIWVSRLPANGRKWNMAQVHTVTLVDSQNLESLVREKELKATDYEACDAYWLLVVIEAMDPAQEQEIRVDGLKITSDKYEKVILFHTFGHVIEVSA